jgi:hypothetical protein
MPVKKQNPLAGASGPKLGKLRGGRAAHTTSITPKPPREQVRRAVKITPEQWRITKPLAAVRAASQVVVGHHQQAAMTFKMVEIYTLDGSGPLWRATSGRPALVRCAAAG